MLVEYITIHNIIAIIIGIVGLSMIIYGAWRNSHINKACRWPSVQATVEWTSLETTNFLGSRRPVDLTTNNQGVNSLMLISTNDQNMYAPKIIYQYTVNGNTYHSDNIMYHDTKIFGITNTKRMLANLNQGKKIIIHYNPLNPAESYIYNGNISYYGIIGGIILLLIASYMGYFYTVSPNVETSTI